MFWGFLLTVFVVNAIVIWVSVPIWNWILRPFTHGIRRFSECGLNFEPFTCLDDGFPCFRPHPPGWEAAMSANEDAIEDASKRLVKAVRTQNAVRHRLMARIDALEDEIFKKGSDGTSTGASKTTVDKISEAARKRVDSVATTAVNLRIKKEVKGMQKAIEDNVSGGEASMYICTCVEPSKQMQAEELLHDIAKAAYDHAEGLLGFLTLLRDEKKSGLLVYDIYLEFETAAQLKDWVESDIRRNYLQLGASIFSIPEGGPVEETMNIHDSISSLFVQPANKYSSRQSTSDEAGQGTKFEWHPKTWKMYLAMNVAFTIVGYPLGDLWLLAPDGPLNQLFDANGNPWPTWVKVILNVSVLVIVVVYVAVPIVIYYAAHWLFEPWTKSSNPIVSVLEEGLPCCLADGPGPDAVSNEPAGVGVELQEV
jgi:antibiotic biosynthesis monooxygenase (ABM) superfamily enzyme